MNVFLSASVPLLSRDPQFYATADNVAIRDAIKALVVEVGRSGTLTFGGHPAVTPLIALVMRQAFPDKQGSFVLFQSEYFFRFFPKENDEFIDVRVTPAVNDDRDDSLGEMRWQMLTHTAFDVAFFIGGMEGIIKEFALFRTLNPNVPTFPIASTGAAALKLYEGIGEWDSSLLNELKYPTLFRRLLSS